MWMRKIRPPIAYYSLVAAKRLMRQQVNNMKISKKHKGPSGGGAGMQNKVVSPNELIRQMHQAQRLETRAWTVLAVAASLVLGISLFFGMRPSEYACESGSGAAGVRPSPGAATDNGPERCKNPT